MVERLRRQSRAIAERPVVPHDKALKILPLHYTTLRFGQDDKIAVGIIHVRYDDRSRFSLYRAYWVKIKQVNGTAVIRII